MKLRIDQQHDQKLEDYRRQVQQKYDRERRQFEEDRQKRLYEIQDSIEKLNLGVSDKQKMKQEVEELISVQHVLRAKLEQAEKD